LLRPRQWLKNLMLYFPPFLGGTLLQPGVWQQGLLPFAAFAAASSSGYILNDILDRSVDQSHPNKKDRPLASGAVPLPVAWTIVALLAAVSLMLGFFSSAPLVLLLLCYLTITAAYSLGFKNVPVVDLFCIATGFLFRLLAGGTAFGITISSWLFLSVLLLSLFLSAGKRLSEKNTLYDAPAHRKVLALYPAGFLEGVLFMTGSAVLVTYSMYTLTHQRLIYTVPLCCFGLLRYILRVQTGKGGDPTESLLQDHWLFAVGAAWAVMVGWGIYA
jgi:4-hydroxybenzoate polyprenyltransferase